MQQPRGATSTTSRQARGDREVGAGDAEQVAEEQLVQPRRRGGREREQHAEPEEGRDHHGDRGVAPDLGRAPDRRRSPRRPRGRRPRRRARAAAPASAASDEAREQRVGERLGAVGELVEDDPAAERAARRCPTSASSSSARCMKPCVPGIGEARAAISGGGGGRIPTGSPFPGGSATIVAAVGLLEHRSGQHLLPGGPNATCRRLRQSTRSQRARLLEVVRRDQDAAALGGELVEQPLEQLGARLVDARERLVEQQDRRVLDERAGDEHALALAARELAELLVARGRRARRARAPRARRAARRRPGRRHHGEPRERAHQRDVERADRDSRAASARSAGRSRSRPRAVERAGAAARARRAARGRASSCRRRSGRARRSARPARASNVTPVEHRRARRSRPRARRTDERGASRDPRIAQPRSAGEARAPSRPRSRAPSPGRSRPASPAGPSVSP